MAIRTSVGFGKSLSTLTLTVAIATSTRNVTTNAAGAEVKDSMFKVVLSLEAALGSQILAVFV